jgi:hypothetical protein
MRRYTPHGKSRKRSIATRVREIDRLGLLCHDCGVNTLVLGEYYMISDELWARAWGDTVCQPRGRALPGDELLCLVCLQRRVGRQIEWSDFTAVVPQSLKRTRAFATPSGETPLKMPVSD